MFFGRKIRLQFGILPLDLQILCVSFESILLHNDNGGYANFMKSVAI